MKLGIIGLGKMGEAIAYRTMQQGHTVIGFDIDTHSCIQAEKAGVTIAKDLKKLVSQPLDALWLMVPQGKLIDTLLTEITPHLCADFIIVDGGNSKFTDSMRRAHKLEQKNIFFLDCGTSGGLKGREIGFCLMIGGNKKAYEKIVPLCAAIATPHGYAHVGPSGAGHYVKMIHNGIEYGLLQAYAEGLHLIKQGSFKKEKLDLAQITNIWNHGSVIRSWILGLAHTVVTKDQNFFDISGEVEATGMGQWTVEEAHQQNISAAVIEKSVEIRQESKQTGGNYGTKIVALLRNAFGGHSVKKINYKE